MNDTQRTDAYDLQSDDNYFEAINFARQLERDLAAAQEENAKLKAEISRIMQAAVNGGYCRRNHAKCECENIAESIRIDE